MLRKELRRHERRETFRRRLLAGSTAVILALGMAAGGAAPAFATPPGGGSTTNTNSAAHWQQLPGEVCVKPSFSTEDSTTTPFSLPALGAGLAYSKVIVKAGSTGKSVQQENAVFTRDSSGGTLTQGDTFVHPEKDSISHVIYCYVPSVPSASTDVDCTTIEFLVGRALNGSDHINVDIVYNGQRGQINVEINEVQAANGDPVSDSGLYALYKFDAIGLPNVKVAISAVDAAQGRIVFGYSTYLTGQWTIEWIQFNSTYFNKDRATANFVVCGDLPTENLVTPTARMVALTCDLDGSYTLDRVEGIRWFLGDTEVQPGTYAISESGTVTVRAVAIAPDYGIEPGAQTEWTFAFTEPDDCVLPCLPASAVSYTYYNLATATSGNPANSGLVTVAARDGYSNELCDDFWVVAAAWNYSSSTSIWPQTLRSTDPAGDHPDGYIDSVGTYFFHAPVECGQGDVYASFTGKPYVGPELFGPSNPFTERFLHSMGFTGPNPTYLNTQPGCNVANPIAPTANPIVECGMYGSIDIRDVANPYVGYTVYRGAADENGSVAGLETVAIDEATEGVFTVVATALNGYIFAPGTERQWEFDLGEYTACPVDVDLRLTYMEECAPDPTYTFRVRNLSDVSVPYTYTVYGNPSLSGSGVAPVGDSFFDLDVERTNPAQSYTVILHWGDGKTIISESTTKASGRDKVCSLTLQPVVDIECTSDGSYTVPSVLGVVWSIDGVTVEPGTYTVAVESTIVLRATAASGYVLYNGGQLSSTRDFTLEFTEPETCELPELPITNASIGFIDPTCDEGQKLDPAKLLVDDETLAKLERYEEFDDGTYEVVFVTTDEDARFFDSSTPVAGRTVSEGGTVLTFTGTLAGPLTGDDCVRSIVVVDPYGVDDRCLTKPSYWVELIEGITYTITVDDEAPVVVEWAGTDERRTFAAERGSTLKIEAAPASELFTLTPPPGPLNHTFAVYPEDCLPTLPLTEGSVTFTPATCLEATNWVVLPNVDGVQWWVDSEQTAAGKWPMAAGDVVVEATPLPGYGFSAEAETRWEYTFPTADEACDLSSLAETGASNALVGVGLAAVLITLAGFGVVIGRRFQQV